MEITHHTAPSGKPDPSVALYHMCLRGYSASDDARRAVAPSSKPRIVSKRGGSRYRSGRSVDWLKMKDPQTAAVAREREIECDDDRRHDEQSGERSRELGNEPGKLGQHDRILLARRLCEAGIEIRLWLPLSRINAA